jgi:small subunit ribosomal protein S1
LLPKDEAGMRVVSDLSAIVPIGEEREFLIIREQNADGQVTLSIRQLETRKVWNRLMEAKDSKDSIQVRVTGSNKGGVSVDVLGLRGFIPRSHLVERNNIDGLKGQTLSAIVIEMDDNKNKIVLSNRLASRAANFSQLEVGQLIEGKITGLRPFGAFVDFDGNTGLLHISQISKKRIDNLDGILTVGQTIRAIIADINEGQNRIALTTKHFESFPGEMLENMQVVMDEANDRVERAKKLLLGGE